MGGRPKALDAKKVAQARAMHRDKSIPIKEICNTLGVGKTALYRYLDLQGEQGEQKAMRSHRRSKGNA